MRIVLCTGMMRSGSTWSYNVCQAIFRQAAQQARVKFFAGALSGDRLREYLDTHMQQPGYAVIKTHFPSQEIKQAINQAKLFNVCTIRDPRDCIVSLQAFTDEDISQSLDFIAISLGNIEVFHQIGNTLFVYYENMRVNPQQQIARVANYLQQPQTDQQLLTIHQQSSTQYVQEVMKKIVTASADDKEKIGHHWIDKATMLHEGHLQGGEIGKWKTQLPQNICQLFAKNFSPWLKKYGYDEARQQYYIYHYLTFYRAGQGYQVNIKPSELIALAICANYQRLIHDRHVTFEYTDLDHRDLYLDCLLKNCIDNFSTQEKLPHEMTYNPFFLSVIAPELLRRHGHQLLPKINLENQYYTGPMMNFEKLIIFQPPINLDPQVTNRLINKLIDICGEQLLILSDDLAYLENEAVKMISSKNFYDAVYLCGHCRLFIGGETALTHFAAACRIKAVISIYSDQGLVKNFLTSDVISDCAFPYIDMSEFYHCPLVTLPMIDHTITQHYHYIMKNFQLDHLAIVELCEVVKNFC